MRCFRASLVRGRVGCDGRARLQALRRRAALRVSAAALELALGAGRGPVARVLAADVTAVQVKRRLVRVRRAREALTLRFDSQEDAVAAAAAMMDAWSIDPSIQTDEEQAKSAPDMQERLQRIAREYLANPELRQSVHDLHEQILSVLAQPSSFEDGFDELATV